MSQQTDKKLFSFNFSTFPVSQWSNLTGTCTCTCTCHKSFPVLYILRTRPQRTNCGHDIRDFMTYVVTRELITQSSSPRCCTVPLSAHLKPIRTDNHYRNIPVLTGSQHSIRGRLRSRHKSSLTPAQETAGVPADLAWTNEHQSAHISQRSEHRRPPEPDTI